MRNAVAGNTDSMRSAKGGASTEFNLPDRLTIARLVGKSAKRMPRVLAV